MTLQDKLFADYIQAMKDKNIDKKIILNYVLSQIKNKKIELQKDLDDREVTKILKKEIKALSESIWFLEKMDKNIESEKSKKSILEFYLPQSKSKAETKEIILWLIKELKITNLSKQRWQIMWFIQSKYGEEIEWHIANKIIQEMLK